MNVARHRKETNQVPKLNPIAQQYQDLEVEPLMLQINLLIKNSNKPHTKISRICGVTGQTLRNWDKKKTKRPQATTLKFVARALGYDLRFVPAAGHNRGPRDD